MIKMEMLVKSVVLLGHLNILNYTQLSITQLLIGMQRNILLNSEKKFIYDGFIIGRPPLK